MMILIFLGSTEKVSKIDWSITIDRLVTPALDDVSPDFIDISYTSSTKASD